VEVKVVEHGRRFGQEVSGRFQEGIPEWQYFLLLSNLSRSRRDSSDAVSLHLPLSRLLQQSDLCVVFAISFNPKESNGEANELLRASASLAPQIVEQTVNGVYLLAAAMRQS
jgi:hypothetical protein